MKKHDCSKWYVGMKVKTKFFNGQEHIVRKLTYIGTHTGTSSGYSARADSGEPCACCGRPFGTEIMGSNVWGVDAGWFEPIEEGGSNEN